MCYTTLHTNRRVRQDQSNNTKGSMQADEQVRPKNEHLTYRILEPQNYPGQGKITNVMTQKLQKKWNMNIVDHGISFNIHFDFPVKVAFIYIQGHNTYRVELTFKDPQQQQTLYKIYTLEQPDQNKIIQIAEKHLVTVFMEVKLLNNPRDYMQLGLNYITFRGEIVREKPQMMMSQAIDHDVSSSHHMTRSQGGRPVEIDLEELEIKGGVRPNSSEFYFGDTTTKPKGPQEPAIPKAQPMPKPIVRKTAQPDKVVTPMQVEQRPRSIIDNLSNKGSVHGDNHIDLEKPQTSIAPLCSPGGPLSQPPGTPSSMPMDVERPISSIYSSGFKSQPENEQFFEEDLTQPKGYTTYPYDITGEWWGLMQKVNRTWVQKQAKYEAQLGIKEEDRMSSKIQVKHLYTKQIRVQGLMTEKRDVIERTARLLGAEILNQKNATCIVVTNRAYGEVVRRKKAYKHNKIVTEQFVFNCKRFNRMLNEDDYLIR